MNQTPDIAIVPETFDPETTTHPFAGNRWGGDVFKLTAEHLAALQAGQTIALDVQNEYIAFLQTAKPPAPEQPVMNYRLSAHAREELDRRQIPPALLEEVMSSPEQKVPGHEGILCYQSRVTIHDKRIFCA